MPVARRVHAAQPPTLGPESLHETRGDIAIFSVALHDRNLHQIAGQICGFLSVLWHDVKGQMFGYNLTFNHPDHRRFNAV